MNKKIKKILVLFAFAFLLICIDKKTFATSISFSNKNPKVNESVTITVSVPNVNTASVYATVKGPGISTTIAVVGGNMDGSKQTISKSATVKPTSTGKITVSIDGKSNAVADGKYVSVGASASVTVSAASSGGSSNNGGGSTGNNGGSTGNSGGTTTNTNCNLKNLGIRPYDFKGFSASKTSYSVNVPNDCKSIEVYAQAAASGATISGTGTKTLQEGTNVFTVTVSNGGNSKKYTISVNRAVNSEAEEVPNVIDEEEPIETIDGSIGIGLETLEIPGFELDKEFKTDVYEYVVKTDKDLTLEELNEIKDKIISKASLENLTIEATAEISEDGVRTITIVVKDEEKEYAKYIITFEKEEKEEAIAGIVAEEPSNTGGTGFGLPVKTRGYIILGCFGILSLLTIVLAIISYIQTRKIRQLGGDYEEDDDSEFNKMDNYYDEVKNNEQMKEEEEELLDPSQDFGEITTEIISKSQKLNGYRNLRGQRKPYGGGRHF